MNELQELLALIDLIRGQHRAGITPPFGQVERLFDLSADVRSAVALGRIVAELGGTSVSGQAVSGVAPSPAYMLPPQTLCLSLSLVDASGQRLPITVEAIRA